MPTEARARVRLGGLPRFALALAYIALAATPLMVAAASGSTSGQMFLELGTALAFIAGAMALLQFLSSGRFERLTGRAGIDRVMGFHRIAAIVLVTFAILHPLAYALPNLAADPQLGYQQVTGMFASPRLRSGAIALAVLALIVVLASVRHNRFVKYEYWRVTHGLAAMAAAGLILHHAITAGSYSAATAARLAWFGLALPAILALAQIYFLRPWRMWRDHWHVESVRPSGEGTIEMVLKGSPSSSFTFQGGQFLWMTIAPNRPPFHDHPFSIASSAAELPRLRLIIRRAGNCTNMFDTIAPGTAVAIDGPHGNFVLSELPADTQTILMVAGGVGIAPLLGMLEDAAANGDTRTFRLLYGAHSARAFAAQDRITALTGRLNLAVSYCAEEPEDAPGILKGPLNVNQIRELAKTSDARRTAAFLCGPSAMMELAADTLLDMGLSPTAIHYERFDYAAGKSSIDRRRLAGVLGLFGGLLVTALAFSLR